MAAVQSVPENVQRLIKFYEASTMQLIKIIAQKEARGNVTQYQENLLKQVKSELQKLLTYSKKWTNGEIPRSYRGGVDSVNDFYRRARIEFPNTTFSTLNTAAIDNLVNNTNERFTTALGHVGRIVQDTVREAGMEAVAQKLATGQTVKECQKLLQEKLLSQGLTGIKTKAGANLPLDYYAGLVARSTTREATNVGILNAVKQSGRDLVRVTTRNTKCDLCAIYEGRVYSISGKDPNYPPLSIAFSSEVYANIHPHCRHNLVPYIPELDQDAEETKKHSNRPFDADPRTQKQKEDYEKEQRQNRARNEDKKLWKKYKTILGEKAPSFSGFRAMKRANSEKWKQLQEEYKKNRAPTPPAEKGTLLNIPASAPVVKLPPTLDQVLTEGARLRAYITAPFAELTQESKIIRQEREDIEKEILHISAMRRGLQDKTPEYQGLSSDDWNKKVWEKEEKRAEILKRYDSIEERLRKKQKAAATAYLKEQGGYTLNTHAMEAKHEPWAAVVKESCKYYPKEWIQKAQQKLNTFFKSGQIYILPQTGKSNVSGSYQKDIIKLRSKDESTAVHELGHLMEDSVDGLKGLEDQFYKMRTQGETSQYNPAYDMRATKDKWANVSEYAGRERYEGGEYEITTVGMEGLVCPSKYRNTWNDDQYTDFVLGTLKLL